jgi:two-component system CheB/CheR fusion protein
MRERDSKTTADATSGGACRAVVGIGASAGGIETLGRFFDAMPPNSGCAFVVILHLDPTRKSGLAPVLSRHTTMPVVDIEDGMSIEPNRVHIIVPDRTLTISAGKLHLTMPAEPRGQRRPVDAFFVSLAGECKHRGVGIVLSGTGNNGTHGLSEIKVQGGATLVEDPATARFADMPRNAVAAGVADFVLAPERMPEVLLRYLEHGYVAARDGSEASGKEPEGQPELGPLLALLLLRSKQDFRAYKRGPLLRRIQRRMGLANVATLAAYTERLRTHPEEVDGLVKDLMISVTGFFRDAEAWEALDDAVITPLIGACKEHSELRFWVPACATGEEAYSLAMLTVERAEAARKQVQLKIFATDRAEDSMKRARDGVYVEAAVTGVPSSCLRRFFDRVDGSYRIKKALREHVIFASQNLLGDPPFSRLDLITCRNLLIYLSPEAQQRVTALFHFALREGGHLFLGNAEGLGRHDDLFHTVSKKWRIYRRLGPTRHDIVSFPVPSPAATPAPNPVEGDDKNPTARAGDLVRRMLLERFAPAAVLIDRSARVLYVHGPTSDYLEVPAGEPTRDLVAMVHEGLRAKLRRSLRRAIDMNESVTVTAQGRAGGSSPVSLAITPASPAGLFLVSFERMPKPSPAGATAAPIAQRVDDAPNIRALEEELRSTREDLRNTIEQLEGANEELKASNEEATSINEELQSTNEELETSKEELQSFNEELQTVNSQLQLKINELEKLGADQNNLLAGTGVATLFLDSDLRITWFSPASSELLDLVSSDIGRPLTAFAPKFTDPNLLRDLAQVLAKLSRIEAEVRSHDGRWYLRRLIPYQTLDNRITGAVLTFTDVTTGKQAADAVNEERLYTEAIVETINQPLLVLAANLTVVGANRAFYTLFRVTPEETRSRLVYELGHRQWDLPPLRLLLEQLLPKDQQITDFEVRADFESIGRRHMRLNARRLVRSGDRPDLILLAIDDVTERVKTEAHRDLLVRELSHRVKNTLATVQAIAAKGLQQSSTLEAFRKSFEGRLLALARSHELFTNDNWSGAEIGQLVRQALGAYAANDDSRIAADGSRVILPPQPSVTLLLVLHELTTNAIKYGALSQKDGRVAVTWRLEDGDGGSWVRMRWVETGGPPVGPPSHQGFSAQHSLSRAPRTNWAARRRSIFAKAGCVVS